jgi:hypothetical protein
VIRRLIFFLAVVFVSIGNSQIGYSQELPETYLPVRAAGMGGAFTAISNDETAVWTNPGGISRIRKARSRQSLHALAFPIVGGANLEGREFYKTVKAEQSRASSAASDSEAAGVEGSVSAAVADSATLGDKPFWARAAVNPITVFELSKDAPAAFGLFSNNTTKVVVDKDTPEIANVEVISDVGTNLGFGFANRSNQATFGLQIRPTYRYSFDDKLPIGTLINKDALRDAVEAGSNKGSAVALDFGGMLTFSDFWYPTLAFAVFNAPTGCVENYLNAFDETRHTICGTVFTGDINNTEALSIIEATDIRIGMSITPRLSRDLGLRFAIDGHHLYFDDGKKSYGYPGVDLLKQLHGGVEFFLGNPLQINPTTVRVGFSQGFMTFGAGLRLGFLSLQFASYGQDISSTKTPREDRRYLAEFSIEI